MEILILITIGYILSYWLRKNNKITQIDHLKFWDSILLVSAIVTAISAIILFLLGEGIQLVDINMRPIHKYAGAITILLMLFHVIDHLPQFKAFFVKRG